jgi:hypothetical protein
MSTDKTLPLDLPDPGTGPNDMTDAISDAPIDTPRHTPTPPAATAAPVAPARRETRVGTVVWGLVVVALGVLALAVSAGAQVDGELAFIALLAGAGLALLVGSLVVGLRRPRERR